MSDRRRYTLAALCGLVAAIVALGLAEAVALVVAPSSSPLFAVGSFVIDIVPPWVKETAIALFGTGDKIALLVSLGILVTLLALALGVLEYRRPPFGTVGLGVIAVVALVAAATRANAPLLAPLPTVLGMLAGGLVLRTAIRRLRLWDAATANRGSERGSEQRFIYSRRGFVTFVAASAGAALVVGVLARTVNAATTAVSQARAALKLPKPSVAAPPIPAGADLGIDGAYPLVTPNSVFYRIDTALQVPSVDVTTWKLRIVGEVENEIEVTFDELIALPLIETYATLACVSNEIGGGLIGNARWLGYPIRELLARAKPKPGADMVLSRSVDGFTAGTPLSILQEEDRNAILAVGMNGDPLPLEHGFPVRMVVPGLFGYVSATKWVTELKVSRFSKETAYWTARGWSPEGPVKIGSRIDVPKYTAAIPVGATTVAGVAWSQHTGISAVEIRVDKGEWMPAKLATAISTDTWVQWATSFEATKGVHIVEVRATDANGKVQSGEHKDVVPDGAEGWHAITVDAG